MLFLPWYHMVYLVLDSCHLMQILFGLIVLVKLRIKNSETELPYIVLYIMHLYVIVLVIFFLQCHIA